LGWGLKKIKTVTICYIHILTYRTERHSRNMDKNQSRYQKNNSKLYGTLKCRKKKNRSVGGGGPKIEKRM
jgi:hypothetical protein